MNPKQANYLILTLTFCLAFLAWGTIFVARSVVDKNYHEPTAQERSIKAYEDCANRGGTNSAECKNIVGVK
jgi:hypothetical protein